MHEGASWFTFPSFLLVTQPNILPGLPQAHRLHSRASWGAGSFPNLVLKSVHFRASSGRESSLSHCCFPCDDAAPRCSPPSVCFMVPSGFWQHAEVKTCVISLIYFLPQILMSTSGHQKYLSLMAVLPRVGLCTELNFLSHSTLASQGLLSHLGKIYKNYSWQKFLKDNIFSAKVKRCLYYEAHEKDQVPPPSS